jgi:dihydroorotate dehydrogenase
VHAEAAGQDAYVAASLIMAELEPAVDMARQVAAAGVRILEFNIGTPYGDEAGGAVSTERAADNVKTYVAAVSGAVDIPVWVKITGQSESVAALAEGARAGGADAVVLMGRFLGMVPDLDTQAPVLGTNLGVGGAWALPLTCYWLARTRARLGGTISLIGTNGARDGLDVVRMMLAGAGAVELSTAVFTNGFGVLEDAVGAVADYLDRHGCDAADIIGRAADRVETFKQQPARPDYWREFLPPEAT